MLTPFAEDLKWSENFFVITKETVYKLEPELQLVNELNYQLRTGRTSFHF